MIFSHEHSKDEGLPGGMMNGGLWGFKDMLLPIEEGPWGYRSMSFILSPLEHFSPDFPSCLSIIRRHFARAFWNQTWNKEKIFIYLYKFLVDYHSLNKVKKIILKYKKHLFENIKPIKLEVLFQILKYNFIFSKGQVTSIGRTKKLDWKLF